MWVAAHSEEEAVMKAANMLQSPASQLKVQQGTHLHICVHIQGGA